MKIRKNSLVLTAAFTGLLAGTTTRLSAAPAGNSNSTISTTSHFAADDKDKKADKKANKDKNSCKGKDGCGSETPAKKDPKKQ